MEKPSSPASEAADSLPVNAPEAHRDSRPQSRIAHFLHQEVDSNRCTAPLVFACFMTGFTSAVSFTACYIWCGFQTGGTIQLALALVRLFSDSGAERKSLAFDVPDRQALTSLLSFAVGASTGRLGDKIGSNRRTWLILATVLQALCLMSAALCAWKCGESSFAINRIEPSWRTPVGLAALGFSSASLGIQGIVGKRLNTPFGTVVLTTLWCELLNDPKLFTLRLVKSRDHRISAVLGLFVGAFCGRALVNAIGSAPTLGIGAGLRLVGVLGWLLVPGKVVTS